MGIKAMLVLEFGTSVTDDQKTKFSETLKEKKLKKIAHLSAAWKISFKDTVGSEKALKNTKSAVKAAVEASKITDYTAAVHLGEEFPEIFR